MAKYTDYLRSCAMCHAVGPSRDAVHLLMRRGPYGTPKRFAYLCEDCVAILADQLETPVPDLDTKTRRSLFVYCRKCFCFGSRNDSFCRYCGAPMNEEAPADEQ